MWSFYFHELMNSMPFFLKGLWMTVAVAGLGLIAATIIGFVLGIIRAGRNKILRYTIGAWVDVTRGTPFLVQVFIIFFILPGVGIELSARNFSQLISRLSGLVYIQFLFKALYFLHSSVFPGNWINLLTDNRSRSIKGLQARIPSNLPEYAAQLASRLL